MRKQLSWTAEDALVSVEYMERVGNQLGVYFSMDYKVCAVKNNGAAIIPYDFDIGKVSRSLVPCCLK